MALIGKFLCIWLTISPGYGSIFLSLVLIEKDGGFSTLGHNVELDYKHRVPKTFPGPCYLCSKDGVVWLWRLLVNLYVYGSPFHLATSQFF